MLYHQAAIHQVLVQATTYEQIIIVLKTQIDLPVQDIVVIEHIA
jgi:hypothetical protein